ncbi:MAG: type VI secretion system baseplate subunit TssK, partial [Variovorax sp.]
PVMPGEATGAMAAAADGESALARYCSDLTERARGGGIDGVVGRAHEIRTMVDILLRRRPLLTGDAGDQHGEPYHFFRELVTDVQAMLNDVLVRSAGSIALTERPNGMRVASVEPSEPQGFASLVFAVAAQMPPDQLATQFPAHCKAAPSDRLPDLIHAKLPGIALRSLPVPPRKIPFNAGFVYFQFQPRGPLWEHLLKYGGMALRVAGELPGLRMELWGVREK